MGLKLKHFFGLRPTNLTNGDNHGTLIHGRLEGKHKVNSVKH